MTNKSTKVKCSPCGKVFDSNEGYLKHKCKATGFKPTQVEHFDALSGGRFSLQSKAALARGEAKDKLKKGSKK